METKNCILDAISAEYTQQALTPSSKSLSVCMYIFQDHFTDTGQLHHSTTTIKAGRINELNWPKTANTDKSKHIKADCGFRSISFRQID